MSFRRLLRVLSFTGSPVIFDIIYHTTHPEHFQEVSVNSEKKESGAQRVSLCGYMGSALISLNYLFKSRDRRETDITEVCRRGRVDKIEHLSRLVVARILDLQRCLAVSGNNGLVAPESHSLADRADLVALPGCDRGHEHGRSVID